MFVCVYFSSTLLASKAYGISESILNQLGKPTKRPTIRWIFQILEGVHVLIHRTSNGTSEINLNINPTRRHILQVLGAAFEKIYTSST